MKRVLLFLVTAGWSISALAQEHPVTTIRLDPNSHRGGFVGDFFEKVEVIPLETTSESLFGYLHLMEVTEHYFIIQDWQTQAVLLFHRDGRFHVRIGMRRKSEGMGELTVDRTTNEILLPVVGNLNLFYDYDGRLLREQKKARHMAVYSLLETVSTLCA